MRADDNYTFSSYDCQGAENRSQLLAFKADIDAICAAGEYDELSAKTARDFFAPVRYVLAHIVERTNVPGFDIAWRSQLPIGSGLGSGAAAAASMALGWLRQRLPVGPRDRLRLLTWRGKGIESPTAAWLPGSTAAPAAMVA
jgi:galactokinase